MIKKATIFILVALTATSTFAQTAKTAGLKGEVKNVRKTGYYAITDSFGQITKGEIIDTEWGYNNTFIQYDTRGNWFEYHGYKPDGSIIRKEVLKFDEKGNTVERYDYNYTVLYHKQMFKNDDKGNIIESFRYNSADSLISKSYYKYDNVNMTEWYGYSATDSLTGRGANRYDINGNCIESYTYKSHTELENKTTYKYDDNGKKVEEDDYDTNGNLLKYTIYKYNDKGFFQEISVFKANGDLDRKTTFTYKYDDKGNWIEEIDFNENIAKKVIIRKIEYYK